MVVVVVVDDVVDVVVASGAPDEAMTGTWADLAEPLLHAASTRTSASGRARRATRRRIYSRLRPVHTGQVRGLARANPHALRVVLPGQTSRPARSTSTPWP